MGPGGERRRVRAVLLALLLAPLVAGCLAGGSPPAKTADAATLAADTPPATNATTTLTAPEEGPAHTAAHIAFEGHLANYAAVCNGGTCVETPTYDDKAAALVPGLVGRITGGKVTMTWSAATPATATLAIGAMTMTPGCRDCRGAFLGEAQGVSPLVFELKESPRPMHDKEVLHFYTYEPSTYASAIDAGIAFDQTFKVEGLVGLVGEPTTG